MRTMLILVALAGTAAADTASETITYRVTRPTDSLDVIAAEFYGDRNDATLIMVENKIKTPRALQRGERLKIPTTRQVITAKGDTFESLAESYLGDKRRAPFLAEFNSLDPSLTPAAGTALVIPFHIQHTATATETLASISTTFFGSAKQADQIKRYNFLDRDSIEKGETVAVPILNVRVRASKLPPLDAESKQRREKQRELADAVADALPQARTAWLVGDFAGVKKDLEKFADELDYLDTPSAVAVGMLLAKAHLADDDVPYAVAKFSQLLDRDARLRLSPYRESPKVIDAWKKASGHLDGE